MGDRIAQLELIVEELEATQVETSPTTAAESTPRVHPVRKPLPEHLPRETVLHAPACECPDCGGAKTRIGEDVAEMLEYVPSSFKVIRHVRPQLLCVKCQRIVKVPAPSRPIARARASRSRRGQQVR